MNKAKSIRGIRLLSLLLLLLFGLGGCGRQTLFEGGTDYPYSLRETGNGRLVIKLDGSKTPGEFWTVEAAAENWYAQSVEEPRKGKLLGGGKKTDRQIIRRESVSVRQRGREKKGKATFVLRPLELCDGCVVRIRRQKEEGSRSSVALNLMLRVEKNRAGNGLAIRYLSCEDTEPGKIRVLSTVRDRNVSYYKKEDGSLVLTLPNLPDLSMQVEDLQKSGDEQESEAAEDLQDAAGEDTDPGDLTDPEETGEPQNGSSAWDSNMTPEEIAMLEGTPDAVLTEETVRDLKDVTNSDSQPFLLAVAGEDGLYWYQDPSCPVRRGSYGVSKDEKTILVTLHASCPGKCRISLGSEKAGWSLALSVTADEEGYLSLKKGKETNSATKGPDELDSTEGTDQMSGSDQTDEAKDTDETEGTQDTKED